MTHRVSNTMHEHEEVEQARPTPIEFVKQKLGQNPEASFSEIKAQGKLEGLTIYPVVYGRAKALLGLVPTAPYGSKSKARRLKQATQAQAEADAQRQAAPHRPVPSGTALSSLESLVTDLRAAVEERDRYRAILERVVSMLQSELEATNR